MEASENAKHTCPRNGQTSDPYSMDPNAPIIGGVPCIKVVPKPGFCVKTGSKNKEKIFINVCTSENVPEAKDLTEKELIDLLQSDDPTGFRIPMSIGEPHAEVDKGGKGCTAYDVVVNPKFYTKIQTNGTFQRFFLHVMVEGIENKFDMELSTEFVILKNRKSVGTLQEQNIRKESKPFIMEMDNANSSHTLSETMTRNKPLIEEVKMPEAKKGAEPKFTIVQEPAEGHPEFLVAEIHLPLIKTSNTLTLDVGEDRILLDTRSNVYYLDIYLPFNIIQEECGSQFNRETKMLTITMPVQPAS
ncbi:PIH1 domain-containing protein 1-like isoform X2 [Gigantopelta aegis]|uniref:PIH1 domain-containing protein 1-like isoform X2 n=1 Tax=Gigantopelta aegis TaxID=1735272 RepID=UPI001B889FE9|nr:PIH1 domain-containing protein 1-like isoform X2 [Gigantopelta aegis]